ncbi:ABC transporter ATP-binding protein [Gracilinema caldarium]|jgi:putative ABC transport system ATP-binding protein|uniref:ABC transporter ATP-binding protein n=1 Tax=Gracilinema caldarium TaxID=215591 RepID=UPI0026F1A152|nr:ABC transporter ATP-binding protein [Gracilinema caldarium]
MSAILELEGITKIYKKGESEVHALDGVNLSIEKGEFTAIVGPSGSGKTTLLNIIGCLDTPTAGIVRYNGTPLGTMKEDERAAYRKKHISFIFQSYNLIPVLTVRENVELPLVIERRLSKAEIRKKAEEVLAAVGLKGLEDRFPRELSGGQEQRVAIARALVKDPYIVLADEPTANLDSHMAEEIVDLMRDINKKLNATFIFSTHDALVQHQARRVITIRDGAINVDERRGE